MLSRIKNVLPKANLQYSEDIVERRKVLIEAYKKEKENPNLRVKLLLISKTLRLLQSQVVFENINKVKALAVYEKDRLKREGKVLTDGC